MFEDCFYGVYKIVWHTGLSVHMENTGVFSVCYKKILGALKVATSYIYVSNMIFPLTFIKVTNTYSKKQGLLMDKGRGKP